MNCYQKILQKNVYRICAGNCKQIASVVSLHRNDKIRGQEPLARTEGKCTNDLSSRTECGDLGFCHYERSEVIQKSSVACEEIASTTPQMWLVAGSHLGFAEKSFQVSQ